MKIKRRAALAHGGRRTLLLLAAGGFAAGFCNGLLGAGGGVILVLIFKRLQGRSGESGSDIYANALVVTFLLSCLTLWRYLSLGTALNIGEGGGVWVLLGAALGGLFGGALLGVLRKKTVGGLFALLTTISGILMLFA